MREEGVIGRRKVHGWGCVSRPPMQGSRWWLCGGEVGRPTPSHAMPRVADHTYLMERVAKIRKTFRCMNGGKQETNVLMNRKI